MTVWYVDCAVGSDAADGLSWGTAKLSMKSIPTASIAPGDEIRFAKSEDPVSCGTATWTDGSTTVTFTSGTPPATTDLISRSSLPWWDTTLAMHGIVSVVGNVVTLRRPYRGASGSFTAYRRAPIPVTSSSGPAEGFGAGGVTAAVSGTQAAPIKITGGWNKTSGTQDGQTILNGQRTCGTMGFNACDWIEVRRFSFMGAGGGGLTMFSGSHNVFEIDHAIEPANSTMAGGIGSGGNSNTGTWNVVTGDRDTSGAQAFHFHSTYGNALTINKLLDSRKGLTQNDDGYPVSPSMPVDNCSRETVHIGEAAWCSEGAITTFNFIGGSDFTVDSMHDNGVGIRPDPSWFGWTDGETIYTFPGGIDQSATFHITDAWNNGVDLDLYDPSAVPDQFGPTGVVVGTMLLDRCSLRSVTPIRYDPTYTTIVNATGGVVSLPATLDATSTDANTTAAIDGTSLVFDAGEVAEWVVDPGAQTLFAIRPAITAPHWTKATLSIGGVDQQVFMVEGTLDIEEEDTMPATSIDGTTATVGVVTTGYTRLDATPLTSRSRIVVTTDPAGTTRIGIVFATSLPAAGTLPTVVIGSGGDSLPAALGAVGPGIYVYGKALDGSGNVGVQQFA